jgi:hypothetical protein
MKRTDAKRRCGTANTTGGMKFIKQLLAQTIILASPGQKLPYRVSLEYQNQGWRSENG